MRMKQTLASRRIELAISLAKTKDLAVDIEFKTKSLSIDDWIRKQKQIINFKGVNFKFKK